MANLHKLYPVNTFSGATQDELVELIQDIVLSIIKEEPPLGADVKRLDKNKLEAAEYQGYVNGIVDYQEKMIVKMEEYGLKYE